MSRLQPHQRNRLVLLVVIVALAVIGFVMVSSQGSKKGRIAVPIRKIPSDTKISVDGKKVKGSTLYIKPGKHTVKGERSGFEPREYSLDLKADQTSVNTLFFVLTPVNQEGFDWAKSHEADYAKIENEAGKQIRDKGSDDREKYPILSVLPYRSSFYSIEYGYKGEGENRRIAVQINASTPLGRQVAIERIRTLGFEPTDYEIEFLGYTSPFVSEQYEEPL